MSKMSQLHAELSEQASELGFESIEQAEANGYEIEYDNCRLLHPYRLVKSEEPDINQAYADLEEEQKANKEAKQIEMVHDILNNAKEMIAMVYKPNGNVYRNPIKDITDEKIRDYYYEINHMCCELSDRNKMLWQKEDNEN